ncbi:hypothetical protein WME75_10635 [Sorangium sp. So ce1014]|uniref:hypothetical protein n=1 Tax=Sorangium sp. So ce1014 TaxID=3133326 RepID=UPI003F637C63
MKQNRRSTNEETPTMAYRTEIDSVGFHLVNTETGQRTTYPSRDHLLLAVLTISVRSWDRILEGITRILESYDRPARQTTEVEP